jgi:hypothetical protein
MDLCALDKHARPATFYRGKFPPGRGDRFSLQKEWPPDGSDITAVVVADCLIHPSAYLATVLATRKGRPDTARINTGAFSPDPVVIPKDVLPMSGKNDAVVLFVNVVPDPMWLRLLRPKQ